MEMPLKEFLENVHNVETLVSATTNELTTNELTNTNKDNIERSIPGAAGITARNHLITVRSMPMLKKA